MNQLHKLRPAKTFAVTAQLWLILWLVQGISYASAPSPVLFNSNVPVLHPVRTDNEFYNSRYRFRHITVRDGLSFFQVRVVTQDSYGFMWIGSDYGLDRFDGYNFIHFRYDVSDTSTIPSNNISALLTSKIKDIIWVGTRGGLCYINVRTLRITRINLGPYNVIRTLAEDRDTGLWVGTQNGLLHLNKSFSDYTVWNTSNSQISDNQIRTIYEDHSGNIWVGTLNKLNKLDKNTNTFQVFDLKGNYYLPIHHNLILTIVPWSVNSDTLLWIGTETGLCLFNTHTGKYKLFRKGSAGNISNDKILSVHPVGHNRVWLGTEYGLNLLDARTGKSKKFYHNIYNPVSLSNNKIWSIYEDRSGILWIATDNGINLMDQNQKPFVYYSVFYKEDDIPVGVQINDIIPDSPGIYWLATQRGVIKYSLTKGVIRTFFHQPGNPFSLLASKTLALYKDEFGNLWIATNKGVNIWSPGQKKMYSFPAVFRPGTGLQSQFITNFERARDGSLWVGTWDGGLHQVTGNPADLKSVNFRKVNNLTSSLFVSSPKDLWIFSYDRLYRMDLLTHQTGLVDSVNRLLNKKNVYALAYSNKGSLWLGTTNGLLEYVISKNQARFYPIHSGRDLPIVNILEDRQGNIWGSSLTGLIKFNTDKHQYEIYPAGSGIQLKGFHPRSCCREDNGDLVFAGQDGFVKFDPEKIKKSDYQPGIFISELYVQNERVIPGKKLNGRCIIKNSVFAEDEITLRYDQRSIRLNFASLQYGDPSGNIFAYQLEGFDPDWKYTSGDQNFAIYSYLPAGHYTFRLRGTNNDGVWSKHESSLKIRIEPPPWASSGAIIFYIFIFLLLTTLTVVVFIMKMKWLQRIQKIRLEKEHNEELALAKQRFFTNISHEFRTPLSLILGPVNEILKKDTLDPEEQKQLQLVSKNAQRLLRLVNQLIDLRKLEVQNIKLRESGNDIVEFCRRIYNSFSVRAERKSMQYSFKSNMDRFETWFDTAKMETVLYNLLANAFNYTEEGGKVSVDINIEKEHTDKFPDGFVSIRVKDTGIGIPEEEQSKIFDRFYQSEKGKDKVKGSGIGLTLVKEYVELHGGMVSVKSAPGEGSAFTVKIPVKTRFPLEDIAKKLSVEGAFVQVTSKVEEPKEETTKKDMGLVEKPVILLVEDDAEVIDFIRMSLEEKYEFITAANGKEAMQILKGKKPDFIISDVMMPGVDGYVLCRSVKDNPKLSYIPVILLSARVLIEQQTEGLKCGADAYVTKPFDIDYLDALIQNILNRQEQFVERARFESIMTPEETRPTSADEKILQQVIAYIESKISDPELNVHTICEATGFSHSFLYRKIKQLTGGTLKELIRDIRIRRAAQLLKTKKFTVAEVMVEVGFSNHSYFSKCFRKVYKKSPGSYANSRDK